MSQPLSTAVLKKMLWVQMHHAEAKLCYVTSPILFKVFFDVWEEGIRFDVAVGLFLPRVYFPWQVTQDYEKAQRAITGEPDPYDDIPF